ncbi:cupin domain-containing protein [Hymenobacter sp. BT175]|uniref:cupin domain-containing protein n=1 Tax=Hymenobacter translucens TaxID=2886507 RepID=UPI001D0EED1A|nr:cupin domain-containing protein [Hymenobacter translucens]MCC2547796.1 cupin domain-containing protein [Hymenobacter translucens]
MEIAHGSLLAGPHTRPEQPNHVLLKRENHRVLRKSFEPGQGMAPHHAPHDVLVVVLSGKLKITVAGDARLFQAGDYVVFPAGAEHALYCEEAAQALIYL